MGGLLFALTLLGALGAGLVAGIFFAFSAFVMTALGRLPAPKGIAAMQSINVAVLNPAFFSVFFGTGAVVSLWRLPPSPPGPTAAPLISLPAASSTLSAACS